MKAKSLKMNIFEKSLERAYNGEKYLLKVSFNAFKVR